MHYDHKQSEVINGNTWKNDFFNPQYHFGFGLSYTSFEYSNLAIEKSDYLLSEDEIIVSVDIKNTGESELEKRLFSLMPVITLPLSLLL